jgi:hypothetical protein
VHPYPAGLNDCAAATRWVHANAADLGISHLIVCGESGGGNLTLTVTHKAKREGWLDEIAGAYAQCPYISNRWLDYPEELPSLRENDGYFISCQQAALLGALYDPGKKHSHEPTCWALNATEQDLAGCRTSSRSTSLTAARRGPAVLPAAAGGRGQCRRPDRGGHLPRRRHDVPHAMPDVLAATVRDISGFARSLTP